MGHDDNDMPEPLREAVSALRTPAEPPDPAADERLRAQVRAMVRAMAPVVPEAPPSSSGGSVARPRRSWHRALPALTLAAGVGLGAALHALLAPPVERIVFRDVVRTRVVERSVPAPPPGLPAARVAPTAAVARAARDGGAGDDALDDARARALLILAEQRLEAGDVAGALQRLRAIERAGTRSPTLLGFRELLFVRTLRAGGDEAGARRRGERYVERHPESAYARDIRDALARRAP